MRSVTGFQTFCIRREAGRKAFHFEEQYEEGTLQMRAGEKSNSQEGQRSGGEPPTFWFVSVDLPYPERGQDF